MYLPKMFEEDRVEVLHELIRRYPFGTLVTFNHGLRANHIPFEVESAPEPFGILYAHVARANPLWRDLSRDNERRAVAAGNQVRENPDAGGGECAARVCRSDRR